MDGLLNAQIASTTEREREVEVNIVQGGLTSAGWTDDVLFDVRMCFGNACFSVNADGVFRNGENQKIGTAKQMGQRSRRERNCSTVENVTDPIPIPRLPIEGARIQRERITKQDIEEGRGERVPVPVLCEELREVRPGSEALDRLLQVVQTVLEKRTRYE